MSSANIAFVQSLYAAFGRGDIAAVIAGLTFDVDWNINGRRQDYPLIGRWTGWKSSSKAWRSTRR
jgi:uncharacterized protein